MGFTEASRPCSERGASRVQGGGGSAARRCPLKTLSSVPPSSWQITLAAMWTRGLAPWYAARGRHDLPWRQTRDPWAVLVSEVMLQQTQVARVLPKWHAFLERFPTVAACAAAPVGEVIRAWSGLGYNRRAVALHAAARAMGDRVPDDP